MYSSDQLFSAAEAIRPYLWDLLDAPQAQQLSHQLNQLLDESTTQESMLLWQLLSAHEATREWIRLYLDEQCPAAEILKALRVYYPLPGVLHPVESPHYICPVESCHQDWYRQSRSAEIPKCPIHNLQLVIDS